MARTRRARARGIIARATAHGLVARVGCSALALALLGCGDDSAGTESTEGAGPMEPEEQRPTPKFIEPPAQKLTVFTHEHADVTLKVEDIVVGNTQVILDGYSVGTPDHDNPIATLTEETLSLHVRGGLVAGPHTLELVTQGTTAVLRSAMVELVTAADTDETVSVEASLELLDLAPGVTARALSSDAGGERGLLLIVFGDAGDTPTLRVLRAWEPATPLDVPLTGYVHDDAQPSPAVTASLIEETVRVAWRVGDPGVAIAGLDVPWGAPADVSATRELAGTPPPLTDVAEWTAYGRPALLYDALVAELHAPADAETPHPGDHQLIKVTWGDDPTGAPRPAQPFVLGDRFDLDAPGPALDASSALAGAAPVIALRSSGVRPALLRRAGSDTLVFTDGVEFARTGVDPGAPASTAAILGALGSETRLTAVGDALALSLQNASSRLENPIEATWSVAVPQSDPPEQPDRLPAAAPSAAAAPTLLLGTPVFLVPYGDEASVHAVYSTGATAEVIRLGELRCDAIATPLDRAGNTSGEQSFACLRDGAVDLGRVRLTREAP